MIVALLEWISPSMFGWLAAVALPWWIHRWWFRRPREVPWAAMRLLQEALRQRSRWQQSQPWLLLALRMLILLLVSLAAAQPVLRQSPRAAGGGQRTHHLLLLDQSYSMACRRFDAEGQPARSRLVRARAVARHTIESASAGDLFSVLGWADKVENPLGRPTTDPATALSAVDQIQVVHAPSRLPVALRAALEEVRQAGQRHAGISRHQIYVVSDMGRNTWEDAATSGEVQGLCRQLKAHGLLWVCPVGSHFGSHEVDGGRLRGNVAITRLAVDPPLAMVAGPLAIEASLRAFGPWAGSEQQVELSIDGQPVARRDVELSAGQEAVVRFETRLLDPGPHTLRVACQPRDDLPLDDQRWHVVQARGQVRLLCLEGGPEGATDLVRALNPRSIIAHEPRRDRFQTPYQVARIPASRLLETDFSSYDGVLVCNVAGFESLEAERLLRYARDGGAALFFLGDQVVPGQYAPLLARGAQGAAGRLPVAIGAAVQVRDIHWDPLGYRHPLVAPFRDHPNAGLTRVTVAKYFKLAGPPATGPQSVTDTFETALTFDTGDPAIVLGPLGSGRVAVVALPASLASRTKAGTPWSSWPINPSFLPMVRELLKQVVGRGGQSQCNRLVGEPLVLPGADWEAAAEAMEPLVVRTPAGNEVPIIDGAGAQSVADRLLLPTTRRCGIYSLRSEKSPGSERFRYAINLDMFHRHTGRGESDLATITPDRLPGLMALLPPASGRPEMAEISLGSTLFATVFVLVLVELGLAWWLGKGWG